MPQAQTYGRAISNEQPEVAAEMPPVRLPGWINATAPVAARCSASGRSRRPSTLAVRKERLGAGPIFEETRKLPLALNLCLPIAMCDVMLASFRWLPPRRPGLDAQSHFENLALELLSKLWEDHKVLHWTLVFLVIAIIAAILGFGGIAGASAGIAKICFFVFLVIWLVAFIAGRRAV